MPRSYWLFSCYSPCSVGLSMAEFVLFVNSGYASTPHSTKSTPLYSSSSVTRRPIIDCTYYSNPRLIFELHIKHNARFKRAHGVAWNLLLIIGCSKDRSWTLSKHPSHK